MKSQQEEKLSVVSVTYNSEKFIRELVFSLKLIKNILNEIIIIDNNSPSFSSEEIFKNNKGNTNIKIIKNIKNVGFSKAVNQGIKLAKSNFILLLNPDTYLTDNSITKTFKLIKNDSQIGVVGGKIRYPNSKRYLTANSKPTFLTGLFEFTNLKKIYPNNRFTNKFWIEKKLRLTRPTHVSSLCGAYLIFRRKINNKLNLFNEDYFMYMEDIEFGLKNNDSGYKVIFDPNSQVVHFGGASSPNKYHIALNYWYKSRKLFFQKNINPFLGKVLSIIFTIEEKFLKIRQTLTYEKTT